MQSIKRQPQMTSYCCVNPSGSESQPDWQEVLHGSTELAWHRKCPRWEVTAVWGQGCTKSQKDWRKGQWLSLQFVLCTNQVMPKVTQTEILFYFFSSFWSPCSGSSGLLHILYCYPFPVTAQHNDSSLSVYI